MTGLRVQHRHIVVERRVVGIDLEPFLDARRFPHARLFACGTHQPGAVGGLRVTTCSQSSAISSVVCWP